MNEHVEGQQARASISFGADGRSVGEESDFVPLDDELVEEEVAPVQKKKGRAKAGKITNRTLIASGVGLLLFVVAMGGFVLYLKQQRAAQNEDAGFTQYPQPGISQVEEPRVPQAAPLPPPVAVGIDPASTGAAPVGPGQQLQGAVGLIQPGSGPQPLPVGTSGPIAPVNQQVSAQPQPVVEQSHPAPAPARQEPSVASQQPVANPTSSTSPDARLDAINQRLSKVEAALNALMPVMERLVRAEKAKTTESTQVAVATAPTATGKATPVGEKKPEKTAAAPADKEKAVAKPTPVAQKKPSDKASASAKEDTGDGVSAIDVRPFSVNSVIGSRAWVVKTQPDGTEVEYSAAPGEVLDGTGRTVVSVDGKTKKVCLDNGQCISKR